MKIMIRAAAIGALAILVPVAALAKVPCEETLNEVRAARSSATLSAADAAKVDELINQGIDRCNADDDNRANGFFKDAMTAIGK
ncbi:hypothetical protein JJB09_18400 [Rhizobium sp. KVB221]|uniref:Secreted protein n=1 Tax=Rhizobium setariae TaxID=2801340 RepID=A0A936YQT9_9HYPH|nr:hypothetical protein [Rhizobium setariae]MBL0373998.1 hypothetical protein [Rhizobium setariae]